jgi:hypothetical protein
MRALLSLSVMLAFTLACSGVPGLDAAIPDVVPDANAPADGEGEGADEGEGDPDEDEEELEPGNPMQSKPDCTTDMVGIVAGVPSFPSSTKVHPGPVKVMKQPKENGKPFAVLEAKRFVAPGKDEAFCEGLKGEEACVFVQWEQGSYGLPAYSEVNDAGYVLVGLGRGGDVLDEGRCRRRGWLKLDEPLIYRPVADLVTTNKLAMLRPGMDGVLFDAPGGAQTDDMSVGGTERPVRIKSAKKVEERWWVEVEVLDAMPCGVEPKVVTAGWAPLHDDGGRLRFWYTLACPE